MNLQLIEQLAFGLRRAIEQLPRSVLPASLSWFPKGACGDASLLLGAYLVDNGFSGFNYVCGERGNHDAGTWTTHAWVAKDELVVDITADQFSDAPAGVIIADPSLWHKTFTAYNTAPSDFREYSEPNIYEIAVLYERLRPVLF